MKTEISFKENGDEYTGSLLVTGGKVTQTGSCSFEVNGASIEIDEEIIDIREIQ